ncbi:type VI secretion system-associated FHA domain protein TagH [Sphingomonas sp. ASY06-1R]|uniref:type VI secretion system-associated FHA domain protein TagH n=1 Tax=Sphingomonas sp. ASY06-1R TaxID=3445771 RepID=UPI003FA2F7BC
MSLTLCISDRDVLDNGEPATISLDRHGAVIGRSPHADWSLPDPRNLISSRHCEISYRDGQYLLVDHSTNGTYLNGAADRLPEARPIADGDTFTIGHYTIVASRSEAPAVPTPSPTAAVETGWDSFAAPPPRDDPADGDGWADPPELPTDAAMRWRSREPAPAAPVAAGPWDMPAPVTRPSAWSSEPPQARASAEDVWGRLSRESEIDWSRGNFASVPPAGGDWGTPATAAAASAVTGEAAWGEDGAAAGAPAPVPPTPHEAVGDDWTRFVAASGLPADKLKQSPGESLSAAGAILRQMINGLMLMIDARARGKAQLGVQATGLELEGNNPLKFVRSPERALLQLINAAEPGFMPAERAIEDAYEDLQAHQMATLAATRGALDGMLARFSPASIRDRQGMPGRLARWFPIVQRARQWDAYERDFEGVVRGADEAFMDVFAKEFRLHYDRHIGEMKAQRRGRTPG